MKEKRREGMLLGSLNRMPNRKQYKCICFIIPTVISPASQNCSELEIKFTVMVLTDAQVHEGLGEVDHALSRVVDGHRRHGQVGILKEKNAF